MFLKRNLHLLSYLRAYKVFPTPVRRRCLCAYKAPVSMALWMKASLCVKSSLLEQSLPRTPSRPKTSAISAVKNSCLCVFCAFLWLKIHLIYAIRSTKDYVRKNNLFMQNEPKFRKSQMNVTALLTRKYDQMDTWSIRKNEPKTNPNEPKTNSNLAQKTTQRTQTNPKQTQFHIILAHFSSRPIYPAAFNN
jgi:hypothetical protein